MCAAKSAARKLAACMKARAALGLRARAVVRVSVRAAPVADTSEGDGLTDELGGNRVMPIER